MLKIHYIIRRSFNVYNGQNEKMNIVSLSSNVRNNLRTILLFTFNKISIGHINYWENGIRTRKIKVKLSYLEGI